MSGGHFDHRQYAFEDIAQTLQHDIDINDSKEKDEYGHDLGRHYPPEVIERFKRTVKLLRKCSDMVHEVDWLLSGDSGPETFMKAWKEKGLDCGTDKGK